MVKLVAVQTSQGTWVRRDDGALDPTRMVNVAQVYAPPSDEVTASTFKDRLRSSEESMLRTATLLASAPDLASMLRELCEEHWTDSHDRMRSAVRKAEALLAKVQGPQ